MWLNTCDRGLSPCLFAQHLYTVASDRVRRVSVRLRSLRDEMMIHHICTVGRVKIEL